MKSVPNILTLIRLMLSPVFIVGIFIDSSNLRIFLLGIYILLGLTDFFDGLISRAFNVESKFGEIADPIADKIFVITALLSVLTYNTFPSIIIIPIWIIIAREIIIPGIRLTAYKQGIEMPVNNVGKIKTTLQIIATGGLVVAPDLPLYWHIVFICGIWLAAALTVYSAYSYIKAALKSI